MQEHEKRIEEANQVEVGSENTSSWPIQELQGWRRPLRAEQFSSFASTYWKNGILTQPLRDARSTCRPRPRAKDPGRRLLLHLPDNLLLHVAADSLQPDLCRHRQDARPALRLKTDHVYYIKFY